ncbi:hypothetical protein CVV38_04165 [Candidatus Peregrinibacteria bacterium HGW-Peregrinibacteria-1]|jgi:hypothetical protein|nr:MAG: hypothetical protein CVV38_04165 [Candidatus Peregrinibacteria bacterium HGW-Peregrinibacteria-1]
MKKIFLLLPLFFLACSAESDRSLVELEAILQEESLFDLEAGEKRFYEVVNNEGAKFYFQYNSEEIFDEGTFELADCSGVYGFDLEEDLTSKTHFKRDLSKINSSANGFFYFVITDDTVSGSCRDRVRGISESFSDKREYYSEEFGFAVGVLEDWETAYLPGGRGLRMTKNFNTYDETIRDWADIVINIDVSVNENVQRWKDIYEMVGDRYRGFTISFVDGEFGEGVVVDEGLGDFAAKHYFIFDSKAELIYEINLRGKSQFVVDYYDDFSDLVDSLKIK